jgi:hypothetical protein
MYKNLAALDATDTRQRLLPLGAYPHLARERLVPVFFVEFQTLSAYWPIAWTKKKDVVESVAVIGFSDVPPLPERLAAQPPEATPLLLQAYPLCLGPASPEGNAAVLIDTETQSGEGEPIFKGGELTPAAERRTDILWLVGAERKSARIWNADLLATGAFEPWRLRLSFADAEIDNEDLWVISAAFLNSPDYVALAARHGPAFVMAIEHHVLSRQRIQDRANDLARSTGRTA